MKRAVIVGMTGQDGTILARLLSVKSIPYIGISQKGILDSSGNLIDNLDIRDSKGIESMVRQYLPSHVFYLAAHHHSSQDHLYENVDHLWKTSVDVQVLGLSYFLEALRLHNPVAKLFYASSSHVFGSTAEFPQTENTRLAPENIYGITKVAGQHICKYYQDHYGQFAAVGILYNHESAHRQAKFLSQKIIRGARAILDGQMERLVLGDLSAEVDWGYAPDFVDAMVRIMDLPRSDTYIIATRQLHSVREFVQIAFDELGLDYTKYVVEDPSLVRPRMGRFSGDYSRIEKATGWKPTLSFAEMVRTLMRHSA
jgi:GDPmannose 4,6-dehydratase